MTALNDFSLRKGSRNLYMSTADEVVPGPPRDSPVR